jgi:hypothetical protein
LFLHDEIISGRWQIVCKNNIQKFHVIIFAITLWMQQNEAVLTPAAGY